MKRALFALALLAFAATASAATYEELAGLFRHGELTNKIAVACVIAADEIRTEDGGTVNHANRLIWAKQAFRSPRIKADEMLPALLATNKDNTVEQITGASDAQIQAAVDAAIDIFATGE